MNSQNPNNGNFIKALIKINHPDWSQAQIEAEYEKQINRKDDDGGCEMCSG